MDFLVSYVFYVMFSIFKLHAFVYICMFACTHSRVIVFAYAHIHTHLYIHIHVCT